MPAATGAAAMEKIITVKIAMCIWWLAGFSINQGVPLIEIQMPNAVSTAQIAKNDFRESLFELLFVMCIAYFTVKVPDMYPKVLMASPNLPILMPQGNSQFHW